MNKNIISIMYLSGCAVRCLCRKQRCRFTKKVGDKIHSDPNLKTVSVMVKDGNVTLAGEVDSQTRMKLAESMAKQIDDVKKIDNKIIIKSNGSPTMPTESNPPMSESNSNMMTNSNMTNK